MEEMEETAKTFLAHAMLVTIAVMVAWVSWHLASYLIRRRFPPAIPPDLAFRHELSSALSLREIGDALVPTFGGSRGEAVCLGRVRGPSSAVLFHSGPKNRGRNVNIHRADYLLQPVRLAEERVVLELRLNAPYSYFRLNHDELSALRDALEAAYGSITHL